MRRRACARWCASLPCLLLTTYYLLTYLLTTYYLLLTYLLVRVFAVLAARRVRILYAHTRYRFELLDMLFFEALE